LRTKKEWISRYIDKAKFDEYKNKHYNLLGNPETITGKREIIAEELNIENIGEYKDLDIDEQLFVNFNNQFNTITKIENSINENTEDDLIKFFGNILDNPEDNLYKKYSDEKMTIDQFKNAYDEIKTKNNEKTNRAPKPTHHMLIALPEDDFPEESGNKNIEQQYITEFMTEFVKYSDNLSVFDKTDDVVFYRDLFIECLNCLNNDIDADINKEMFKEKSEKIIFLKKQYKELKSKIDFISNHRATNKYEKNFLLKYNIKKDDSDDLKENLYNRIMEEIEYDKNKYKPNYSFRDYLRENNQIQKEDNDFYISDSKTLKINEGKISFGAKRFLEESGINKKIEPIESTKKT